MNVQIKIKYNWSCDQGFEIPEKHKEALIEDAQGRIFEMIAEGYREGELLTSVRYGQDIVSEEDEEEGLSYNGWWSIIY